MSVAVAFFSVASLRAQELPKAPQAQMFTLTPEPGYFTEPAIAVNPNKPQQVVAVYQDNVHAANSSDAGHSWETAQDIAPKNYRVSGDVSTTFDNEGRGYVCYMAFDKLGTSNYWARGATRNGLFVKRSLDGGKTWEADHFPIVEHPTEPGIDFDDKPFIVADTTKSRFAGNLYVGWTRWRLSDSQILISRSTDHGKTWSAPVEIDAHPGLPRDDNGAAEGFNGVVAPDGTLYAVWSQDDAILLVTSHDGGKSFSPARPIIHTAPIIFAVEGLERADGFPQIALDPRSKRLYVAWSDYRNGDLDIFVSVSDSGGKHWSPAARVNNDPVHDGAEQFFQWLAVDPVDASVNVLFYDRRGDALGSKQIVVLARSTDSGRTFTNYSWTTEAFNASGVFFGDYTGLAAYGGRVYGAWMEKPIPAPEPASDSKAKPDQTKPRPRGTVIKVGTADFNHQPVR